MMPQRGVSTTCSNRKRKFDTIDGVPGDLHPANPCEEEEFGSSSDSGRPVLSTHVAANWAESVVSLTPFDEGGTTHPNEKQYLFWIYSNEFTKFCRRDKSADLKRTRVVRCKFPVESSKWKGTTVKLKTLSPSHMSCLEGCSRMPEKQSACHYCDPEGRSAPGDRFKQLFPGLSWPAHGDAVSREAARNRIRFRGYPFPVLADPGMRLLCSFEKEFDEDIWSKLPEKIASDMSQSVVALASFNGIFIGCNEITTTVLTSASLVRNSDDEANVLDNLKIEVRLPDNQNATGTLECYNLRYNIATITINYRCTQTVQIVDQLQTEPCGEVAAIGRVYESGKLIATGGTLIDKPSAFDCKELKMSTCKITKAGIGGPLIDCYGNFIGMDFYSSEETPYLPRTLVLEVLRSFNAKSVAADLINDHNPNRWPVPKPCWCYPTWHIYMGDGVDDDHEPQLMQPINISTCLSIQCVFLWADEIWRRWKIEDIV